METTRLKKKGNTVGIGIRNYQINFLQKRKLLLKKKRSFESLNDGICPKRGVHHSRVTSFSRQPISIQKTRIFCPNPTSPTNPMTTKKFSYLALGWSQRPKKANSFYTASNTLFDKEELKPQAPYPTWGVEISTKIISATQLTRES